MKKLLLVVMIFFMGINSVFATSGFLRKDSIKTCNGILYGQHSSDNHWHKAILNDDGGYNAVGLPIYSNPCGGSGENEPAIITTPIVSKSNENTLLKLSINGEEIQILDNMSYTTNSSSASLIATSKDSKATVDYEKNINLNIGSNEVKIIVKSESGITKSYSLLIKRETLLSSNNNIIIKIDNEVVEFESYVNKEIINVNNSIKKIDITYETQDKKTKVEITNNEDLKEGNNEITLVATAEDGTKQEYKINVYRYTKAEDIIYSIVALGIVGGAVYGVVKLVKKRKTKNHLRCF